MIKLKLTIPPIYSTARETKGWFKYETRTVLRFNVISAMNPLGVEDNSLSIISLICLPPKKLLKENVFLLSFLEALCKVHFENF